MFNDQLKNELDSTEISLSPEYFQLFCEIIHQYTGITIQSNRHTMLISRLNKRLVDLKINSFEDYYHYVLKNEVEKQYFIDCITTNETYFYRTPRIWEYLEQVFLVEWYKSKQKKHLIQNDSPSPQNIIHAWSAAASTGAEAHTLALVLENFKSQHLGIDYQITGTDISKKMIDTCLKGHYKGRSIESIQSENTDLFNKYMKQVNEDDPTTFCLRADLKKKISFKQHNLFNTFPSGQTYDIIMLRNVLIYFTREDQEHVLSQLVPKLSNSGVLIIGESESLNYLKTDFESVAPLIYKKK